MPGEPDFWSVLQELVETTDITVDRPAGTAHPAFPEFVYPLDYGYLDGTVGGDGHGVDVWLGGGGHRVTGVFVTADPFKRDAEVKVLLGCGRPELDAISAFYAGQPQKAVHLPRPSQE